LQALGADRRLFVDVSEGDRKALLEAASRLTSPTDEEERNLRRAFRRKEKRMQRAQDAAAIAKAGVRAQRRAIAAAVGAVSPAALVAPVMGALPLPAGPVPASPLSVSLAQGARAPTEGPEAEELQTARNCYVCKAPYRRVHPFYDSMCCACGDFNYQKRTQTADLRGRVALMTGSRLKIGYEATLMLLRAGATVIATTRFPVDSAKRYAREHDFEEFRDRLHVHGLDLRHTPSVELFARFLTTRFSRLDYLINNAAQTVRRPPGFYAHLLADEERGLEAVPAHGHLLLAGHMQVQAALQQGLATAGPSALSRGDRHGAHDGPEAHGVDGTGALALGSGERAPLAVLDGWQRPAPGMGLWASARLSQIPYSLEDASLSDDVFPVGALDNDRQQVDLRTMNSWRMRLSDVPTPELIEVHLVNTIAPFVLCSKLKPLMLAENTRDRHVVNVSAMEGQFNRGTKTDKHPHTNMAKAALNMLTRTSASDYARDGIYMNSVDTGWVTDEDPAAHVARKIADHGFEPPLDIVDGAARIVDPIFHGANTGEFFSGKFLKDYRPTEW
jgi:NAD(P)-dependent dehydrogenase (short-subunit alcohol dehydrogenase family)